MWEIVSTVATAVGTIIAAVSLVIACVTQRKSVDRERRQATIEAFALLQKDVLDKFSDITRSEAREAAENCMETEEERQIYHGYKVLIARIEHFAIGIKENTYDFDTFYQLGGVHVGFLYKKVEPIIQASRNRSENGIVPFEEFEHLFERICKKAISQGITIK